MTSDKSFLRNRKGFSLVEMIIAVAVLSLMGLVIIQVFIHSDSLNRKAADMDHAVSVATNLVEKLKTLPEKADLEKTLKTEALSTTRVDAWSVTTIKEFYDRNWKPVLVTSSQSPEFTVTAVLQPDPKAPESLSDVNLTVVREEKYFHSKEAKPVLFTLKAAVPLSVKGGGN